MSRVRYGIPMIGQQIVTLSDLPPAHTTRWTRKRKAIVVEAVSSGLVSLPEVTHRYNMSTDEFCDLYRNYQRSGVEGLKVRNCRASRRVRQLM